MLLHHLMLASLPVHLLCTCRVYAQQCGLKGAAQCVAETEQGRWHCSPGAGSLHQSPDDAVQASGDREHPAPQRCQPAVLVHRAVRCAP